MNILTVGDLKAILNNYPDNMKLIVTDAGPSHDHPILEDQFKIVLNPYFPSGKYQVEEDEKVLRIALI